MFMHSTEAPAASPTSFERPIDLVHLARQTLGDRALEAEILQLFVAQTATVLARLKSADDTRQRGDLAHTLKGSARAVGAWRVAVEAEACEAAASGEAWSPALARLEDCVAEAIAMIDGFRRAA